MIDEKLLAILACPEDKTPLSLAGKELVEALNKAIAAGRMKNREGTQVSEPLDGGLVRSDEKWLYPIRDDIPVLLPGESLPLPPPEVK